MKAKINQRIKLLRQELGISQNELAIALNITANLVACWENGSKVRLKYVKPLCLFFNVSADYLLGLSDNRNITKR